MLMHSCKLVVCSTILLTLISINIGCDNSMPSDRQQANQQEIMSQQSNQQVGVPGITKFTEKRMAKFLYELRDKNVGTFAYILDMQGHLHHICDSVGYGLPYGVQFTNPEKRVGGGSSDNGHNMPQAEPNGLFMPPTAEGTWIICAGRDGSLQPIMVEPRTITSPVRLNAVDSYQIQALATPSDRLRR